MRLRYNSRAIQKTHRVIVEHPRTRVRGISRYKGQKRALFEAKFHESKVSDPKSGPCGFNTTHGLSIELIVSSLGILEHEFGEYPGTKGKKVQTLVSPTTLPIIFQVITMFPHDDPWYREAPIRLGTHPA